LNEVEKDAAKKQPLSIIACCRAAFRVLHFSGFANRLSLFQPLTFERRQSFVTFNCIYLIYLPYVTPMMPYILLS